MATTISVNSLPDDDNGVNSFYSSTIGQPPILNNLLRASTVKRILSDGRIGLLFPNSSIPASKISGPLGDNLIPTQSLSGAIGAPLRNGQLAWYTITPVNLAHNAITWNSSKQFGINVTVPLDTLHVGGSVRLGDWSSIKLTDGNGRVSWYGNAATNTFLSPIGSERASRITQSLGEIIFYNSEPGTTGGTITWLERVRIKDTGRVGIGIASPSELLDVNGNAKANNLISQSLQFTNNLNTKLYIDSSQSTLAFDRSGVKVLDLYSDKIVFRKESITVNSIGNRLINENYGVYGDIYKEGNIVNYRLSVASNLNGYGARDGSINPFTINLGNGRVGIGGDPGASTSLKVTGDCEVTGTITAVNVVGNINASGLTTGTLPADRIGLSSITSTKLAPGIAIPPGAVMSFVLKNAPSGWLKCNGDVLTTSGTVQGISAPLLGNLRVALINEGNPFGVDGTNPKLPDLRGQFIRGWADNGTVDESRIFGSNQEDTFKTHTHTIRGGSVPNGAGSRLRDDLHDGNNSYTTRVNSDGGGSETRPKNIALMYCIKY